MYHIVAPFVLAGQRGSWEAISFVVRDGANQLVGTTRDRVGGPSSALLSIWIFDYETVTKGNVHGS